MGLAISIVVVPSWIILVLISIWLIGKHQACEVNNEISEVISNGAVIIGCVACAYFNYLIGIEIYETTKQFQALFYAIAYVLVTPIIYGGVIVSISVAVFRSGVHYHHACIIRKLGVGCYVCTVFMPVIYLWR